MTEIYSKPSMVDFIQGFTQNRRDYTFDLKQQQSNNRIDLLSGFTIGWTFPIYRRETKEFYYN